MALAASTPPTTTTTTPSGPRGGAPTAAAAGHDDVCGVATSHASTESRPEPGGGRYDGGAAPAPQNPALR